ncbi:very-long-chain (3R)-3-hydroxyacyl-CoA dehydratase 4 isoform X2 [Cynoglossus semilaevis]|nr:very-long-chain (3R)-3-hydroxyacyl-CoA dehydratase 4 isoform X2 [Cynoglossus semilaevis]
MMSACQLFSILELFHIADGIERARLLPRFVQVMEKNLLLILVIMLEEIQSKPVICVQFLSWNILDLLRYPLELLRIMDTPSVSMLWIRYTLWIPVYILSVATEGVTIYQALPLVNEAAPNSFHVHLPFILLIYLPVLALGASVTVWQLLKERKHQMNRWNNKKKRR